MKKEYTSRQGAKEESKNKEGRKEGQNATGTVPAFCSCFPAFLIGLSVFSLPWRLGALA
jgi:hypothetical protein